MAETTTLPIGEVKPCATNPRRHFDQEKLKELAASIAKHGVLQPLVVRKNGKGHEIVAGERRYRAAVLADVKEIPVRVITISDEDLLELQLIENDQREDLTPMERAKGYSRLMDANPSKYTAAAIAERIGKTPRFVWDHVRLLKLVPEAQKLLTDGRILVGHAFILSKLKPADQKQAIDAREDSFRGRPKGGLWQDDTGADQLFDEGKKVPRLDAVKPISVRELAAWVAEHVRFDPAHAAAADPMLYDDVKASVEAAEKEPGRGKKVVQITHEYLAPDAIRNDGSGERILGERSWRRADGLEKSKKCEHSVLGVHVAGPAYGQAYEVCVNKDKCATHWKAEKAARARAKKQRTKAGAASVQSRWEREEQARRRREQAQRAAYERARPGIVEVVAKGVGKAKAKMLLKVGAKHAGLTAADVADAQRFLGAGKAPEHLLRIFVLALVVHESREYWAPTSFAKEAAPWNGHIKKALAEAAAAIAAESKGKPSKEADRGEEGAEEGEDA